MLNKKQLPLLLVGLGLLIGLNYLLTGRTDQHNDDWSAFWVAGHLFDNGISPYDHSATTAAQELIGNTRHDALLYATPYPLWTILLFAPFGWMDVDIGAAFWLTINELLAGLSFFLLASTLTQDLPKVKARTLFKYLFGNGFLPFLVSVHFIRCLLNGQLSIIILASVAFFVWAVARKRWEWAGLALSAVLFKPTSLALFAPIALGWLLCNKERRGGVYVFAGVALALGGLSLVLDPAMLSHMYNASTEVGRSAGFRNATLWGTCATIARYIAGPAAEPLGWGVAAGLGLLAAYIGWYSLRKIEASSLKDVLTWSFWLTWATCLAWYAFSYEAVLMLMPLLAILALTWPSPRWQRLLLGAI
jgi:hypothetical protein